MKRRNVLGRPADTYLEFRILVQAEKGISADVIKLNTYINVMHNMKDFAIACVYIYINLDDIKYNHDELVNHDFCITSDPVYVSEWITVPGVRGSGIVGYRIGTSKERFREKRLVWDQLIQIVRAYRYGQTRPVENQFLTDLETHRRKFLTKLLECDPDQRGLQDFSI
jgi:hypothetical protein